MLCRAVLNGDGVGFIEREFLGTYIEQKCAISLDIDGFSNPYRIYVTYRKARPLGKAAETFLTFLRQRKE